MNLDNNDASFLICASLFRKIRAVSRSMRKIQWVKHLSAIRSNGHCPLSFVGKTANATKWEQAGIKLGLLSGECTDIVRAADTKIEYLGKQRRKLRRILLKSANLSPDEEL